MAEERAVLAEKAIDEAIKDRDQCYKTEKQMKRTRDLEKDKIT